MKKHLFTIAMMIGLLPFPACQPRRASNTQSAPPTVSPALTATTDSFSRFIPADTANKMLSSYLQSINYTHNDTDLQSLIIDVKQLRRYIDSMPGSDTISYLKLMFSHTLGYANSSKANTNAGYNSNALTIIMAACSANGYYMLYSQNTVLDYARPCPPICPVGNASSPLIN